MCDCVYARMHVLWHSQACFHIAIKVLFLGCCSFFMMKNPFSVLIKVRVERLNQIFLRFLSLWMTIFVCLACCPFLYLDIEAKIILCTSTKPFFQNCGDAPVCPYGSFHLFDV